MVCPPAISEAGARRPNVLQICGLASSNYNNPYFSQNVKLRLFSDFNLLAYTETFSAKAETFLANTE
jgi:hypothetical protein